MRCPNTRAYCTGRRKRDKTRGPGTPPCANTPPCEAEMIRRPATSARLSIRPRQKIWCALTPIRISCGPRQHHHVWNRDTSCCQRDAEGIVTSPAASRLGVYTNCCHAALLKKPTRQLHPFVRPPIIT